MTSISSLSKRCSEFPQLTMGNCPPGLLELPKELIYTILIKGDLSLQDISNCSLVSKQMSVNTREEVLWRWLFHRDFKCFPPSTRSSRQAYQNQYRYCSNVDKGVYASSTLDQDGKKVCFLAAQGNQLISAHFDDYTIKIWDLNTEKCLNVLKGHTGAVLGVVCAPDGVLVSVAGDNTIKLWDSEEEDINTLKCVNTCSFHGDGFMAIFFVGQKYFSGLLDGTIRGFDWDNGLLEPLEGHTENVLCFACVGEELLISGSEDTTIRVWDLQKWKCCGVLEGHAEAVTALEVVPGKIISGSTDCTIKVWDQEKHTCLYTFKRKLPIWGLTFKEERLFSRYLTNGSVDVWNLRTEKHCYTIQERSAESSYYGLSFVNGKLYTGCIEGGIQVRDFVARDDVVLKELMDIFRNGIKKDAKAAMQRLSRMPEAVIEGVRSELDLVLGFDGAQEDEVEPDEVEPEDVALAIENYLKKYYSVVLEELISMFRNEADEDDEEAMERWSKVPKAVRLGIRAELDLVLGFDSTQLDEVDRGDMARAIENYLKKHYSHSS